MQLVFALVRFEPRQVRHESLKDLWAAPGRRSRPGGDPLMERRPGK